MTNDSFETQALACFDNGFNCAQAVLRAFAKESGLDEISALKVTGGFGAGMGRLQSICGVLTATFMVIGCHYGKLRKDDSDAKEKTYALVQTAAEKFRAVHGYINCRELLGCDMNTDEGKKIIEDQNFHVTKCHGYVRTACRIIDELIYNKETKS
ncbi:MAG: C-GCAxxG-C-C family protein [Candidatus Marinimicrobia bacterium]|nr:C-GCAxxG-C-C family protein [Candidatus Neomarinimicrobiota bacterium]